MPACYAHYRFGQDVIKALPVKYRTLLTAREKVFSIGTQGPDLLFYYKPFSHDPLHAEGHRIHLLTGREYFAKAGSTFAARGMDRDEYAYLCGYICHFALDRACHDYINDLAARGQVSHEEIESEFERILMEEDGLDPVRTNAAAHIHPSRRAAEVIAPYFPGVTAKEIRSGIHSLRLFNGLMTIPGHIGYRWVDSLLRRMPSYDFIHGHMINLDPNPLCEDSNRELRRRYEDAVGDACLLIRGFLPAVRGKRAWPSLMDHDFEGLPKQSAEGT